MNIFDNVEIEQGSADWLAWRAKRSCASDAPVIMNAVPDWYDTRNWNDLRVKQAGLAKPVSDFTKAAFNFGHENEINIRSELNRLIGRNFQPVCIETEEGIFGASLDGFCAETGDWLEIKSPISGERSKLYNDIKEKTDGVEPFKWKDAIHPYVWWQMVHHSGILQGLSPHPEFCHLVVAPRGTSICHVAVPFEDLHGDWPILHSEWLRFLNEEEQFPAEDDILFQEAAAQWIIAKNESTIALDALAKTRKTLIEIAGDRPKIAGYNVAVTRSEREGTINWKGVAQRLWEIIDDMSENTVEFNRQNMPDELEAFAKLEFQGKPTQSWTIREAKS